MEYAIKEDGLYRSLPFKTNILQTKGRDRIILDAKLDTDEFGYHSTIRKENTITQIQLPNTVSLRLSSKCSFTYTVPGMTPKYQKKRKVEDFLYEITYGNIDYDYAYRYFQPLLGGGCSAIKNGNFFGRNFDWLYNNQVQFVVHTPSSLEHYGVLGVSSIIPGVGQSNVDDDEIIIDGVDMFKLVPFYLVDGINERGLFCTHNVVPLDNKDNPTRIVSPLIEEKERVCIPMLVRFILDRFCDANDAIEYIRNYVTLYFSDEMINSGYQSHFMIGDNHNLFIIEFINEEIVVEKANYITNFNIHNVTLSNEGKVQYPPTEYGIDKYGFGLERWDIIVDNYPMTNTHDGMRLLLDEIRYSRTFYEPFWYSELVTKDDNEGNPITVDTDPNLCSNAKLEARRNYRQKDRSNPKTWITCHSSIYDIKCKKMYITNQENGIEYMFVM